MPSTKTPLGPAAQAEVFSRRGTSLRRKTRVSLMSTSSPSSPIALPEPASWAIRFGNQLRYLRATLTEETAENRATRLEQEIRSGLQVIDETDRERYLAALAQHFPSWEQATALTFTPKLTAEETIEAFFKVAGELSAEQREELKGRLEGLGLMLTQSRAMDSDILAEVQAKFKLDPKDQIDPQRLGKLFVAFAEVMLTLDQLVWNVWKNASPKSQIRRDASMGDLRQLVRRSLTGDAEASALQVQQLLENTRQLIAGLLASFGSAGESFAQNFQKHYSPESIGAAVKAEGGGSGLFGNVEAKNWKKYTELAIELSQESIESDVRDSLIKYAESLILGSKR
jgi:hypothetical protein